MEEDQSLTPMLVEMARVQEEPSTPSSTKKIEEVPKEEKEEEVEAGLYREFAVGSGISSSWDDGDVANPEEDECGCESKVSNTVRMCTRGLCKLVGAKRLGHMAVLFSRKRVGDKQTTTRLLCIVGPFWPFAFSVTYPLVILVSTTVAVVLLPGRSVVTIGLWAFFVLSLLVTLSLTACRNPGILRRHAEQPASSWRWNDQARTFRPPGAVYDDDLGLVVEQFDHLCPWTGTGIGANNLAAFHAFVSLLCVCIIFDVLLHEEEEEEEEEVVRTVYCEGISYEADEEDVRAFFAPLEVVDVRLPRYQDSGKIRGYAHVDLRGDEAAERALEKDREDLKGRYVTVRLATEKKETPRRTRPEGCRTLFAKNVPYGANEDAVRNAFSQFGKVEDVRIPSWQHTKRTKGFAYVQFAKEYAAERAYAARVELKGRALACDYDADQRPKSSFRRTDGHPWAKTRVGRRITKHARKTTGED
ncbi:hypothetical protein CTAYLR_000059 [Chrysophaeum taylorii]|uniref:Palmitoyltransferase n=1 Tax=Chrysophaeum taylorii TaxID=2483200 RepID=A0AAD7UGG3_9STRA|nr:hypothetical protein CTAYLR_000059 [Chrysophaeum taylorii]